MFPSFLLSLREGLEAALIIGIALGVLSKIERPEFKAAVWLGVGVAVLFSLLVSILLFFIGVKLEGRAEEIYEGMAMLLAAGVLTWMIFWMQQRASSLRAELEAETRRAAVRGGQLALFTLAFLAVGREGFELALFLVAAGFTTTIWLTIIGAALGLGLSLLFGWLLFKSTLRLNLRAFFRITSVLLILFAAGLVAHGVHEFNEAGIIPPIIDHVWDMNWLLPESTALGQMMTALFGYNGNPSLTEVTFYLAYFACLAFGLTLFSLRQTSPVMR
jgi:high-affinity iron transporter